MNDKITEIDETYIGAGEHITISEPRASREQAGHTQHRAAELIGVARRTWQDWERNVAPIPSPMLRLYRHVAGIERIPFRKSS